MPAYVFYAKEREVYKTEFALETTQDLHKVELVIRKLARHFKFTFRGLLPARNMRASGRAYPSRKIKFSSRNKLNVGVIVHETAHLMQKEKDGRFQHNKKLMRYMDRMFKYIRKNEAIQQLLGIKEEIAYLDYVSDGGNLPAQAYHDRVKELEKEALTDA
jgi:hypothetical protein